MFCLHFESYYYYDDMNILILWAVRPSLCMLCFVFLYIHWLLMLTQNSLMLTLIKGESWDCSYLRNLIPSQSDQRLKCFCIKNLRRQVFYEQRGLSASVFICRQTITMLTLKRSYQEIMRVKYVQMWHSCLNYHKLFQKCNNGVANFVTFSWLDVA